MTRTAPLRLTEFLTLPHYIEQFWEVGWLLELALWNNLMAQFGPSHDDHPYAKSKHQLVIPEPLAEDNEHGLFA